MVQDHWVNLMNDKPRDPDFLRIMFTSLLGTTHSIEVTYDRKEEVYEDGICFDGSSVPGYAQVNSSDLLLRPIYGNPIPAPWDPHMEIVPCRVYETAGLPHRNDPINILTRFSKDAERQGFRLLAGFELEFFLVNRKGTSISPADYGGYFATVPSDLGLAFRREVMMTLRGMNIATTTHHHEVAMGQHEIGFQHSQAIDAATSLMLARHVIAEIAVRHGFSATFMAKPFVSMNGSGMHIHQSLWTPDLTKNLFATEKSSEISDIAEYYVAGILEDARALSAIVAPTVNSFKRLVPGFEAPTRIAWGPRNRTTMLRIPHFNGSARKARIEFRCPDPSSSPHLCLAAIMASGLRGIQEEKKAPNPTAEDLFHSTSEVGSLPGCLGDALEALESNLAIRQSLGEDVIDTFLSLKRAEWNRYVQTTGDPGPSDITDWELREYLDCN